MMVSRIKPKTLEIMVMELTAANDLSKFIERVFAYREKEQANKASTYAILRAATAQSQAREFTGQAPEINLPSPSIHHSADRINRP